MFVHVQRAHSASQHVEWQIAAAFDPARPVLVGEANVQPHRTFSGELDRLVVGDRAQSRLLDQLVEILFRQAHQLAIGQHGHGGVAPGFRHQRLLTKAVACAELGQLRHFTVGGRFARHQTAPGLNDVVIIASASLLHDHLTGHGFHRFHVGEDALDIGGGQTAEQIGTEHAGHPIPGAIVLQIEHFHLAGLVVEAIVGKQAIEHGAIDLEYLQRCSCTRRELARLQLGQRVACVLGMGIDLFDQLTVGHQLELPLDDEEGEVVLVALLEDVASLAVLDDFAQTQNLLLVLRRQTIDGDQLPQGVGKLVGGRGHLAGQMLYAFARLHSTDPGCGRNHSGRPGPYPTWSVC